MTSAISNENYTDNSLTLKNGDVFLCLPKGERFITQALSLGAKAIIKVKRPALSSVAAYLFGDPSQNLIVIGITGTNGKTTVAHLLSNAFKNLGKKTLVIGTLTHRLTTPDSLELQSMMRCFHDSGGEVVVMEVSSHGIDQHRIKGINFDIKVLTNITHDHLDYHQTFIHYKETKLRFMNEYSGISCFPEHYLKEKINFKHKLFGVFNDENMKAAYSVLLQLGVSEIESVAALETVEAPEGRFQCVNIQDEALFIIDYAHTPDGLDVVSKEASLLAEKQGGRLIIVFGCGGDRDKDKRAKMGKIAETYADVAVVTSDNPRNEDPMTIINEIILGMQGSDYVVQVDRYLAIKMAVNISTKSDVVLVAGKGHEHVQIIGSKKLPFNDKLVIQDLLKK
jgi:UDP-N-acetylmuramoyl-L-alanyl-D-glutamate--2,6-diaminopimelate ligase